MSYEKIYVSNHETLFATHRVTPEYFDILRANDPI